MFWRKAGLLLATFVFIFGWKMTDSLDLILITSSLLAFWVFIASRVKPLPLELQIAAALYLLSVYSLAVVLVFGAADLQPALRSVRALINFVGAAALVQLFYWTFREKTAAVVVANLYLCTVIHAAIICAMFLSPTLRTQLYALTSAYSYLNVTAPVELGLRVAGLTYGLASTSVVQLMGLLLLPVMLGNEQLSIGARVGLWLGAILLVVSMLLTGRTGLLFGIFLVPLSFLMCRSTGHERVPGRLLKQLGFAVCSAAAGALVWWVWGDTIATQLTYSIQTASEVIELLDTGSTATTQYMADMFFLPATPMTLLFGSSNLGRGPLGYLASDVGYVQVIFALGLIGLACSLLPYLFGAWVAASCYVQRKVPAVAAATLLVIACGLMLNFKELALLTRNQWSIQAILIAICCNELLRARTVNSVATVRTA